MNKLVVIGHVGIAVAYLNISKEEAIKKYIADKEFDYEGGEEHVAQLAREFSFEDKFSVYAASEYIP